MMILEIFAMFDSAKVEIKREHQSLMVSKATSFKKGKGKKGILHETTSQLLLK